MALGVFRCGAQTFDAIGVTADIDRPPAPIASDAYDPLRKSGGPKCCDAQHSFFNDVVGCDPLLEGSTGAHERARVHHTPRRRGDVAARGACAAARPGAADRCPDGFAESDSL